MFKSPENYSFGTTLTFGIAWINRTRNEGVRIAHLDPNTRMNSKDEYRQGTNIMMQPVRGVGA